jgi:hypothetical protein
MMRRLATALVCAPFLTSPAVSVSSSPAVPIATPAAVEAPVQIASPSVTNDNASDAKKIEGAGDGFPHQIDAVRQAAHTLVSTVGRGVATAIGTEPDAKIRPEDEQTEAPPLTREAICQVLTEVSAEHRLPTSLFARLIWQESRFRPDAVSPVGARGIAQFMPGTAAERGLEDAFDPIQALPASADFLRELVDRFGNFGLAAAAYNGGPRRVRDWLAGRGGLPRETRDYVIKITGRTAEHWAEAASFGQAHPEAMDVEDCNVRPLRLALEDVRAEEQERAARRVAARHMTAQSVVERVSATWIALLTGNWTQKKVQTVYAGLQKKYPAVLGRRSPTVRVAKASGKRSNPQTMVSVVAQSRDEAEEVCKRLKEAGGTCKVQKDPV